MEINTKLCFGRQFVWGLSCQAWGFVNLFFETCMSQPIMVVDTKFECAILCQKTIGESNL